MDLNEELAQIWERDHLVVVHPDEGIVYAQATAVEFTPVDMSERTGLAVAMAANADGWRPDLLVEQRFDEHINVYMLKHRAGITLIGSDSTGTPFTWYFAGAADRYLQSNAS
jgi:hypothetical protein